MLYNYSDDCHLLNAIKEGNESAFQELYEKYRKALFVYAFRVVNDEQVCFDLVNDAFILLWTKREKIINDSYTMDYLFKIVRSRALNYIRDAQVQKKRETFMISNLIQLPEDKLEQIQLNQVLTHAISSIPSPASRRIFEMCYLEDMTSKDIAISKSISINTVRVHLMKAIKILRNSLKNYSTE